jgi:hypothetical protein
MLSAYANDTRPEENMMRRGTSRLAVVLTAAAAALTTVAVTTPPAHAAAGVPVIAAKGGTPHHPPGDQFTRGRVDNPWFPLKPGNRLVYRGSDEGKRVRDVFFVSYRTKVVDGVVCREVRDRVVQGGHVVERTSDWYAQTKRGVVWYFGERTATLDGHGHVISREGSFQSGRDGAEAGIFMPAHPHVGQSFLQENYPGHAMDRFRILKFTAHTVSPIVDTRHAMLTRETTRLEPGVIDHKLYVRDIGTVVEKTVKGGSELLRLAAITHIPRSR